MSCAGYKGHKCNAPETKGTLCTRCASIVHPGQCFFKGRWRTYEQFHDRVMTDPSMRGVTWERVDLPDGIRLIGRKGSFEIRLRGY